MTDRIDKFLNSLSIPELQECGLRIKKRLGRPRGRPQGRSKTQYHRAVDTIARRVLKVKQNWLDDHPGKSRVPEKSVVQPIIDRGISEYAAIFPDPVKAEDAIRRRIALRIREFLPKKDAARLKLRVQKIRPFS